MRLLTAGHTPRPSFGATEVLGARKFVAAVVDDIVRRNPGGDVGSKLGNLGRNKDRKKNQNGLYHV
jgi:hypothetical protein